eukprot:scaffold26751_cov42-Prasinocladus_malaysianus.AAC.1
MRMPRPDGALPAEICQEIGANSDRAYALYMKACTILMADRPEHVEYVCSARKRRCTDIT